jgi:hypothetical protein
MTSDNDVNWDTLDCTAPYLKRQRLTRISYSTVEKWGWLFIKESVWAEAGFEVYCMQAIVWTPNWVATVFLTAESASEWREDDSPVDTSVIDLSVPGSRNDWNRASYWWANSGIWSNPSHEHLISHHEANEIVWLTCQFRYHCPISKVHVRVCSWVTRLF